MGKDGRAKNGGARPGAGRKARAVEADLQRRLKRAVKGDVRDDLDKAFGRLFQDLFSESFRTRAHAQKLFFGYMYGRPYQRIVVDDDGDEEPKTKAIDLSQLNKEELEILERAGEILARARGGQG